VFVAMSFDQRFQRRWEEVIEPGINSVQVAGQRLKAYRVNASVIGDSILTEILGGIGRARIIFADVTSHNLEGATEEMPIRNGNVMYEVGIAHATRLPEEVLLFRSDRQRLLFDVANVRVNCYDPDNDPETARTVVSSAISHL
jgi:hypothetical protein